jgi:hypothetical protein
MHQRVLAAKWPPRHRSVAFRDIARLLLEEGDVPPIQIHMSIEDYHLPSPFCGAGFVANTRIAEG